MSSLDLMSHIMTTSVVKTRAEHRKDATYIHGNSIKSFYDDSVILITGGTGFLGKALVEKLLRSCSSLAAIFLLIRPKKDQTVDQRLKQMLQNPVFEKLRAENPAAFKKLRPVKGDVSLPDLGLSPEDRETLTQKVTIVFHSAATVRFDEPLKVAINMNTKGTDRVIELCKSIKNLVSFVHVSTAYSNANRNEIGESVYFSEVKPSTMIDMCDTLDNDTINVIEKKILETHPNTYTFTKSLTEQLIVLKASDLPVAIVRPSIVAASQKDPYPGWVDNSAGLTGFMKEILKGIYRIVMCDKKMYLDVVPVDYVIDTLICVAWHSTMQRSSSVPIYNCTCKDPPRWGQFWNLTLKYAVETPSTHLAWYPGVTNVKYRSVYEFFKFIFYYCPAFLMDSVLRLVGQKPWIYKYVTHVNRIVQTGAFFSLNQWKFHRDNMDDLTKKMKALKDSDNFNVDLRDYDMDIFVRDYVSGIKKFIMQENPSTDTNLQRRLLILYFLHRFIQVSSIIVLVVLIKRFCH